MADIKDAMKQGMAQLDSIKGMVEALRLAYEDRTDTARETAERTIRQDALSVEVRSGWFTPGRQTDDAPEEYRILLCTGGPACQIVGRLNAYGEPETAEMQVQDWGTPWTRMPTSGEDEDAMLSYASCFYFGEGGS